MEEIGYALIEYIITKPRPKITRQEIRQEKPAYTLPIYRPPSKPIVSTDQIYPRETYALDIHLKEWDINIDFEEKFPT